ncbi:membrane protein [Chlamydia caviae]|uniref:Uncharacterized protein n=1 Tax=Chlamydia caviae (strain ATCC VR-813 / DSM 19441 / 03DC25 / GPIC) TaxID=227941 RepID=Q824G4_CHLCV|nr:membrane protein [Chlamydia caviae]AAP04939.1 conserved hypothetical protein [Chlamydia caviae GPIC]
MITEIPANSLHASCQQRVYASSRNIVMTAAAAVFLILALILSGLSFLPQATLPFSGAYFIIGSFLVFIAAGILLINTLCDACDVLRPFAPLS